MGSSDLRHPAGGDVGKGLLAGFVGGLAGTWAMATFGALWTRTLRADDPRRAVRLRRAGVGAAWHAQSEPRSHEQAISPSERLVDAAARNALGRSPTPGGREVGGSIVHYAFGAVTAAVYGAVAEIAPTVTRGAGLPYGTAVWLIADEIGIPLAGLAEAPTRTPLRLHAYSLGAHFAYGLMTEITRRTVRRML